MIPFEDLPPEVQAQVAAAWEAQQKQADMHNMAIESARHRILNFIESLDEEGLNVLLGMIRNIVSDSDNETAGYYSGLIAGMLGKKGVCMMCHVKHPDPTLDENVSDKRTSPEQVAAQAISKDEEEEAERARIAQRDTAAMPVRTKVFTVEETQDLVEYNLKLCADGGYLCNGCNAFYPTLEDRKLRDPGPAGCDGCKQTTRWGGVEPTYDPDLSGNDG